MGKSLEDCGSAPIGVRGSAESWGRDNYYHHFKLALLSTLWLL